jgi:hypothetical protein
MECCFSRTSGHRFVVEWLQYNVLIDEFHEVTPDIPGMPSPGLSATLSYEQRK